MRVSFLVCLYNGREFIQQTMDSIERITVPEGVELEVLVVNDGSTDQSPDMVRNYHDAIPNLRVIDKPNGGLGDARNVGFQEAAGEWIAVIDQDDLVYPNRLVDQLTVVQQNPDCALIFANTNHIDASGQQLGKHFDTFSLNGNRLEVIDATHQLVKQGCFIDSESLFVRRDLVERIGYFHTDLPYACDFEFFLRAGLSTPFGFSTETVAAWRRHPQQLTYRHTKRYLEVATALSRNFVTAVPIKTRLLMFLAICRCYTVFFLLYLRNMVRYGR